MDFLIGGLAAGCACFFTNPMEVIKVRMQLQGEMHGKGKHPIYYNNVLQAGYIIAKHDGPRALQAGLIPALCFQVILNGFRLGTYQKLEKGGFLKNDKDQIILSRSILAGGLCGAGGAFLCSPIYLIKTHLQAKASKDIAFGYQHQHRGLIQGILNIYNLHGVKGLFRGSSAAVPRAFIGSTAQLTSFMYCKECLYEYDIGKRPILSVFIASMIGGIVVAITMTPLDLISTRLYNQGVTSKGRGMLYDGITDCVYKIYNTEGIYAFYKGFGASYFRLGPHTVLTLVFWDFLKDYYNTFKSNVL